MERKTARSGKIEPTKEAKERAIYLCERLCVEYYYFLSVQQGYWLGKTEVAKFTDLYYAIRNYVGSISETRQLAKERFGETLGTEELLLGQIRTGWTQPMLKAGLQRLTLELNRLPRQRDIDDTEYLPSAQTVRRVFGCSLTEVRKICGLKQLFLG